jgi:hypothetical protein
LQRYLIECSAVRLRMGGKLGRVAATATARAHQSTVTRLTVWLGFKLG